MGIDERSRHALYLKLEEKLGTVEAGTLMEHLPPAGWADVAMKRDLDQLAALMKTDLDRVEGVMKSELGRLEARVETLVTRDEFERVLRTQTFRFMTFVTGLVTTVAGIALAITRL